MRGWIRSRQHDRQATIAESAGYCSGEGGLSDASLADGHDESVSPCCDGIHNMRQVTRMGREASCDLCVGVCWCVGVLERARRSKGR